MFEFFFIFVYLIFILPRVDVFFSSEFGQSDLVWKGDAYVWSVGMRVDDLVGDTLKLSVEDLTLELYRAGVELCKGLLFF